MCKAKHSPAIPVHNTYFDQMFCTQRLSGGKKITIEIYIRYYNLMYTLYLYKKIIIKIKKIYMLK